MVIEWTQEMLQVRTATGTVTPPADAPAAPAAPADAPAPTEPAKPADAKSDAKDAKEPTLRLRGLKEPRGGDDRPVFVYIHWPHEDGARGKETLKACNGPIDEAAFIRASFLFRCVEVNARDSEQRLLEEAKAPAAPGLALCRPDGTIVWRGDARSMDGKALASTLVDVLRREFPEKGKELDAELKSQAEKLKEATALASKGAYDEALDKVRSIVDSRVRIGPSWLPARSLLQKLEAAKAKAEKAGERGS